MTSGRLSGGGWMRIAIVDAARTTALNRKRQEELQDRERAMATRVADESLVQHRQRQALFDEVLIPFRDAFSRLKNVDLAELTEVALAVESEAFVVSAGPARTSARRAAAAMLTGVTTGAGAGSVAWAAVGTFAAASTGTPIAALSGAAATNATLAFLGGGTIAAGGGGVAAGTVVLTSIVAAPVVMTGVGFLVWQGRRMRRAQRRIGAALDEAEAVLEAQEARIGAIVTRSRHIRGLLEELRTEASHRLPAFVALVCARGDYSRLTRDERAMVAAVVALINTIVAVMATPLTDDTGAVSSVPHLRVRAAERALDVAGGGSA